MTTVTADNINMVIEDVAALDQHREMRAGCETWAIFYEPGHQRGQMTVWPDDGRSAVCWGADSSWGDWDGAARILTFDSSVQVNAAGEIVAP